MKGLVRAAVGAAFAVAAATSATAAPDPGGWVAAFTAPPQQQLPTAQAPLKPLRNQTVRAFMPVQISGSRVRVRVSNEYGTSPLMVGAATVALAGADGVLTGEARPLSFGGRPSILAPVGAAVYSDPVDLAVPAGGVAAVSLHLPRETLPETHHRSIPNQDSPGARTPLAVVSGEGDFTRAARIEGQESAYLFVTRLDVVQPRNRAVVAVLGTTRTAGPGHWPDYLARRLNQGAADSVSVVNASMVANPLTLVYPGGGESGLARFDRDVLSVPGVTHVVLADAINDIGQAYRVLDGKPVAAPEDRPTVESLAQAYLQMTARARAKGIKVIAATLLPFEGVPFEAFYSPGNEQIRLGLNEWIRTSGAFDGVIDMDAILRDPANPLRYAPGLHTANNFAPNDAGERRLADAIDLGLFR